MSTLQQHTPQERHRTTARPGAALALTALIALAALGVALLILMPAAHLTATRAS
jgi:hypothetical protein